MGIPLLTHQHERCMARLPFRLTFNNNKSNSYLETCGEQMLKKYKDIGTGTLKSIGIDGSVIPHSSMVVGQQGVNITDTVAHACDKIMTYVQVILDYFQLFKVEKEGEEEKEEEKEKEKEKEQNNNNNNNNNNEDEGKEKKIGKYSKEKCMEKMIKYAQNS